MLIEDAVAVVTGRASGLWSGSADHEATTGRRGRRGRRKQGRSMTPVAIERWLAFMGTGDTSRLDNMLDDAVTFYSPAVFTPQAGRDKASAYLVAADKMFADTDFRYIEHWYGHKSAVLEFRADIDGIAIEGIDMIHWNDDDKIVSFKVMVRPLKALQTIIPRMGELLR